MLFRSWLEYDLDAENKPTHKIVSYETASRHGEPFERMILRKLYLPNAVTRICTIELKIKTAHSYCLSIGMDISSDEAIMGFRYDEPRRAAKLLDKSRAPMYLAKHTVSDVLEFWEKSNFDLKLQSINGQTKEGNCDLCFMKG